MNNDMLNSIESAQDAEASAASSSTGKQAWVKPELQKIDAAADTDASKPNNATFESSPGWGIS